MTLAEFTQHIRNQLNDSAPDCSDVMPTVRVQLDLHVYPGWEYGDHITEDGVLKAIAELVADQMVTVGVDEGTIDLKLTALGANADTPQRGEATGLAPTTTPKERVLG